MFKQILFLTALWIPSLLAAQSDVAFPAEVYAGRRARFVEQVGPHPIIISGEYLIRSGGAGKQDPNFWYLTGVESPYAVLVLVPQPDGLREVLFLPGRYQFAGAQYPIEDPRFREAAWNQPIRRLAPGEEAEKATGIGETHAIDELLEHLPDLIGEAGKIYFARDSATLYAPPGLRPPLTIRQQLERTIATHFAGRSMEDATPLIERMRLIKDEHEIAALRKAAEISAMSLNEVLKTARPGMNDLEIAGLMEYVWKKEGSPRTSFGIIVSSGDSAVSLYTLKSENYNSTDRIMKEGELLFIDYGAAEWKTYTSDLCRTYPVSGRFTPEQKKYYEIVNNALDAALEKIKPGAMMLDVVKAAAGVFHENGLEQYEDIELMGTDRVWGIMPSPTQYILREKTLSIDYSGARGTGVRDLGHHIGLEALDSRDYSMPLSPGMVFTVEPKLYIPDKGIAIMIEEMILVTEAGYENLSAGTPRSVEAIEEAMAAR
jgi:Xaa-Pro aminopeptidase